MTRAPIQNLSLALVLTAIQGFCAPKTGPAIGQTIPDFSAPDQNGAIHTLKTITGPKGAMLVFYRSADW
jgi:hypothetical protein